MLLIGTSWQQVRWQLSDRLVCLGWPSALPEGGREHRAMHDVSQVWQRVQKHHTSSSAAFSASSAFCGSVPPPRAAMGFAPPGPPPAYDRDA